MHEENPTEALVRALTHLSERHLDLDIEITATGAQADSNRYFGFGMAGYRLLVPQGVFSELVIEPNLAALPNASAVLMGLHNHRGDLVPVFQLHGLLDAALPRLKRALLIGKGSQALGLLIDDLPVNVVLSEEDQATEPETFPAPLDRLCDRHHRQNGVDWYRLAGARLGEELLALSQGVSHTEPHI